MEFEWLAMKSLKCLWRPNCSWIPIGDLTSTDMTFIGIKGNIHYNDILPPKHLSLYFPFQSPCHCLWDCATAFSLVWIPGHNCLALCAPFKHEERFCPCPTFSWGHAPSDAFPNSDGILCTSTALSSSEILPSSIYLIASTCNLPAYF